MRTGEIVDGRFVVEKFVARGGMGDIYRARDRSTGRPIALKMIMTATGRVADRMQNEARALLELTHPAVVRYVAHGTTSEHGLYLAMEWLDGVTLWERLHAAPLDLDESLSLVARVADGLGVAHERGMVHRDIKPLNLLLVGGRVDRVKILDFGIVRWGQHITATGAGIGTPEYMAPEQARGERGVGPAADVFSLGCVLFKCLTGQVPFRGEHVAAILAKVAMLDKPPRVSELRPHVPPLVDDLVARMMAHSPEDRPADGAAAAVAIREVHQKLASEVSPLTRSRPTPSLTRRENQPISVIYADLGFANSENPLLVGFLPTDPAVSMPSIVAEAIPVVRGPSDTWQILPHVRRALEPFGARVEPLLDGSLVAMLGGASALTDLAVRSARCALAMRTILPDASIGVATLQAQMDDGTALGEVIDGAVTRVRSGLKTIRIDRRTQSLLGDRFEMRGDDEGGFELVGEREQVAPSRDARRLLGRVTPFVGRNRILRQLLAMYHGCVEDRAAQALVIVGEAGVGKSRLRAELLSALTDGSSPPAVLFARGDPLRSGLPFGALARAILGLLAPDPPSPEATRAALLAAAARRIAPAEARRVAEFLGELCGAEFPAEESLQLRAARQDPALMADQRRRAFEDWLVAECAAQPILLVIEDIQWVDRSSVELVAAALRRAQDLPLLVVALARHEANERFPHLGEEWKRQELRLEPLRPADCEEIVKAALGDRLDAGRVRTIVDRSAGNPFFLEELIRAAAAGESSSLPDTVLGTVQLRLARLPESVRHMLRAASVFGAVFQAPGVARLLGEEAAEKEVQTDLEALVDHELLNRLANGSFAFRHDLVREAAYRMLTDSDRRVGHQLAGEWLLENGEKDPVVLAEHFAGSGAVDQAMDWFQRAAEEALGDSGISHAGANSALRKAASHFCRAAEVCAGMYANENALAFYERALALWAPLDPAHAARARVAYANLLERTGQRERAMTALQQAAAEAERAADTLTRIDALLLQSDAEKRSSGSGALERAWHLAENARDLAQSVGARELEARALTAMASAVGSHETEESSQKAIHLARLAVSITTEHGDLATRLWRLGNGFFRRNDLERAALMYRDAIALAERAGAEILAALCRGCNGMVQFRRWNLDAAVDDTQHALTVFQRVGHRVRIAEMKVNLGTFWMKRGSFAPAEMYLKEVLSDAAGDWILSTNCLDSLAQLERHFGRETEAQQHLMAAAKLCADVGVKQKHALFLGMLAESQWAAGEFAKAMASLEQAAEVADAATLSHPLVLAQLGVLDQAGELLERFRDADPDPDRKAAARLALARVHWWSGDVESARQRCLDALEVLAPTPLPRFALPAEALMACLENQIGTALAALRAAKLYCSPATFDEVTADVGYAMLSADRLSNDDVNVFLAISSDPKHKGVRFRISNQRRRLFEVLGDATNASTSMLQGRDEANALVSQLPEPYADAFLENAWGSVVR